MFLILSYIFKISTVILLSYSCSHTSTDKKETSPNPDSNIVNIEEILRKDLKKENLEKRQLGRPAIKEYDKIERNVFGPTPKGEIHGQKGIDKSKRVPIVLLSFGPGLYRVSGHISFLKSLRKNRIPVHMVSGRGLGAVISAMFASGMTSGRIEWIFYQFFKKSERYPPYSSKWLNQARKILLKRFKGKTIQSLVLTLILPFYNKETGKVDYLTRGDLYTVLLDNLILHDNFGPMKKFGADLILGVDILGRELKLERKDKALRDLFGRAIKKREIERNSFTFYYQLPTDDMALDSTIRLPMLLHKTFNYSEKVLKKLADWLQNWSESRK